MQLTPQINHPQRIATSSAATIPQPNSKALLLPPGIHPLHKNQSKAADQTNRQAPLKE